MTDYLIQKDEYWYYSRRVPRIYAMLDQRQIVRESTGIKIKSDPKRVKAARVAALINDRFEAYWRGLVHGQSHEARVRYDAAKNRSRALGFDYKTVDELAGGSLVDIMDRINALVRGRMVDDDHARVSLLGFEPRPSFLISNLFEAYEGIKSVSLMSMSPDQIRKWRNPKKRAIANLIDVIGDLPIDRLTRSHALEFRDAWRTRVLDGAVKSDTANKDLSHISTMLKAVIDENRLSLVNPFDGLALDVGKAAKRIPYANDFIQNHLLKNGALSGLNTEARRVLYLMVETGLRLSEAVNLTHETIKLDDDVPHVQIRADGRKLKTDVSERDIPLVGVSLDVMRLQPHGFPRYRDKSASLSSTVNKFLRENDLSPHGETAYSLRHSFDDRLINSGAGDKVVAALMGHTYKRMDYGRGPSLTVKRDALLKIAFDPPVDL